MATITLIGCIAAAIVGLTQVYKGVSGAIEAYREMKKESQEEAEV